MAGTQQVTTSYVIQHCEKSYCNKCNSKLSLLCPRNVCRLGLNGFNQHWTMFYICFNCRTVYQVGIGKLEAERGS